MLNPKYPDKSSPTITFLKAGAESTPHLQSKYVKMKPYETQWIESMQPNKSQVDAIWLQAVEAGNAGHCTEQQCQWHTQSLGIAAPTHKSFIKPNPTWEAQIRKLQPTQRKTFEPQWASSFL